MKKVVSTSEVFHLWAHQSQPFARNANESVYFDSRTIYSYGTHFPMGSFVFNSDGARAVVLNLDTYSVTTTRHQNLTRRALPSGVRGFALSGGMDSRSFPSGVPPQKYLDSAIVDYRARIDEAIKTAVMKRAGTTRDWAFGRVENLVREANSFAEFFSIAEHFAMPENFDAIKTQVDEARKLERKERKEREARELLENAEKIRAWQSHDSNYLGRLSEVYLRVSTNCREIETSWGARFPIDHALKALRLIEIVRTLGEAYQHGEHSFHMGHYRIDKIDVDGNVTAGCHHVKYSEIARIAPEVLRAAEVLNAAKSVEIDTLYSEVR